MPLRRVPQLWVRLDRKGPIWMQLYRALKDEILAGRIAPGARMPSTRTMAGDLGVSRNTAALAFDQLTAEGYLAARHGSGTFVPPELPGSLARRTARPGEIEQGAEAAPSPRDRYGPKRKQIEAGSIEARPLRRSHAPSAFAKRVATPPLQYPYDEVAKIAPARHELIYGLPEPGAFPWTIWRRIISRRFRDPSLSAIAYGPPEGLLELREAIAGHLEETRGVRCSPGQIIITLGSQQALQLLARILVDPADAILIEEPHYSGARIAFLAEGTRLIPVPVDEEGINLSAVPPKLLERARLAYVTPSHQFPTGAILSLRRRLELLEWANRAQARIIEDDYDSEFRYGGRAIESLQALDETGSVIYVGTFAKTLFPALRVGYIVVPIDLLPVVRNAKWIADWSTPTILQAAIADFIQEGHFVRHVRRLRDRYGSRRAALRAALEDALDGRVRLPGSEAGLHMLVRFPGLSFSKLDRLIASARHKGVGLHSVASYYLEPPKSEAGILVGYTLVDEAGIIESVRILAKIVGRRIDPTSAERG